MAFWSEDQATAHLVERATHLPDYQENHHLQLLVAMWAAVWVEVLGRLAHPMASMQFHRVLLETILAAQLAWLVAVHPQDRLPLHLVTQRSEEVVAASMAVIRQVTAAVQALELIPL